MPSRLPQPDELLTNLIDEAIRLAGGDEARWREILGPVHVFPADGQRSWNWAVVPGGGARERATIAQAVERLKARTPLIGNR
jgi:hypothetical protein